LAAAQAAAYWVGGQGEIRCLLVVGAVVVGLVEVLAKAYSAETGEVEDQ
jgi:uncharacterized membrane protein